MIISKDNSYWNKLRFAHVIQSCIPDDAGWTGMEAVENILKNPTGVLFGYTLPQSQLSPEIKSDLRGVASIVRSELDWSLYEMSNLYVLKEHRNKGIGQELVKARIDYIKTHDPKARGVILSTKEAYVVDFYSSISPFFEVIHNSSDFKLLLHTF
jgi:GNAT superfamily N-acetyltransferase